MPRETISTPDAPGAIGPYVQAVAVPAGRMVFCSGQIPLDPKTGEMVGAGDVRVQAARVLDNLGAVLAAAGASFAAVVKTTGIVKIETIEPMIANKRAFHAALDELKVLPLGQAVA